MYFMLKYILGKIFPDKSDAPKKALTPTQRLKNLALFLTILVFSLNYFPSFWFHAIMLVSCTCIIVIYVYILYRILLRISICTVYFIVIKRQLTDKLFSSLFSATCRWITILRGSPSRRRWYIDTILS